MKDLTEFLFKYIDPGEYKMHRSYKIDSHIEQAYDKFLFECNIPNEVDVHRAIVGHFYQFMAKDSYRRFYSFCSFYGEPAYLITDEVLLDHKIVNGNISLIIPHPISVVENGFNRESFIEYVEAMYQKKKIPEKTVMEFDKVIQSMRHVVGYFVYRDNRNEAQVLDLTEKSYFNNVLIRKIVKNEYANTFLCEGYDDTLEITRYWTINDKCELIDDINQIIEDLLGHKDFYYIPASYDIGCINLKNENRSLIFSLSSRKILNEFPFKDLHIVNLLNTNPKDYAENSMLLLEWSDMQLLEQKVMFAKLMPESEEYIGTYFEIPGDSRKILKVIQGTDIMYSVTDRNDDERPFLFTIFWVDKESNEFKSEHIITSAMPIDIYVSQESGVISYVYKMNNIYQKVLFWKELDQVFKYSHIEVQVSPLDGNQEEVEEQLEQLKNLLIETNPHDEAIDEWEINHYYVSITYDAMENGGYMSPLALERNPVLKSDYYVNVTTKERDTSVHAVTSSKYGNFIHYEFKSGGHSDRIRKISNQVRLVKDPEIEDWLKEELAKEGMVY